MIYLCLAHMSEAGMEQKYVKEAFDTNWVVPMGPNVNAFEQDLERFVNLSGEAPSSKVVCLSSGTAAVHLALIACGVQAGDEVIVQSFTFCASSHPITYLGAKPVFVDSERETWNMDPELLELAILDRKAKTGHYPKAIIPVALYGMPYRIDRIMAVADKYGIPVIEDAAEGMGSCYKGSSGNVGPLWRPLVQWQQDDYHFRRRSADMQRERGFCTRGRCQRDYVVCHTGKGRISLLPAYGNWL